MDEQLANGMREIDLATGKIKDTKPLKAALDYAKWDAIATRVTEHEDVDDDVAEYSWVELPHAEIRVRIPVLARTKSKQCKVVVKLNWLTVYAPPPDAVVGFYPDDRPPNEPLLDFQLHGAVDPDECDWELVDDGAVRNIILTLHRSPVYKWPTLHRVNGLKSEAERAPRLAAQKQEWEEKSRRDWEAARRNPNTTTFEAAAAPPKPPAFGPANKSQQRPQKPKDEHGKDQRPAVGRPPGVYERGRIVVTEPDWTDSDED